MFSAGTHIHTKEGLRPIEEIKVGDYVLSKPENGEGELTYKRVTKTFVRENTEVFGVTYGVGGEPWLLVTTAEHPFWVSSLKVKDPSRQFGSMVVPHGKWMTPLEMHTSQALFHKRKTKNSTGFLFSTYDGKEYPLSQSTPICTSTGRRRPNRVFDNTGPHIGVLWPVELITQREARGGGGIDFSMSSPTLTVVPGTKIFAMGDLNKKTRNTDKETWVENSTEYLTRGYQPRPCTVYNFEVEDYHTYFVGEHGIWVQAQAE